ncbi:MAG: hypothetical protein CSB55_04175 [Candidatus Cloacimonadota bacterium]|nr:MAG: hypothetical protein CSB55_04175 [Candidatus Cloacimonadota bacterium]
MQNQPEEISKLLKKQKATEKKLDKLSESVSKNIEELKNLIKENTKTNHDLSMKIQSGKTTIDNYLENIKNKLDNLETKLNKMFRRKRLLKRVKILFKTIFGMLFLGASALAVYKLNLIKKNLSAPFKIIEDKLKNQIIVFRDTGLDKTKEYTDKIKKLAENKLKKQ